MAGLNMRRIKTMDRSGGDSRLVPRAYLVMTSSPRTGWAYPITEKRSVIGRDSNCQLPLVYPTVSRRHCEVWAEDDRVYVRDLSSANGTFVNGGRVRKQPLQPGDVLQIGPLILQVVRAVESGERVFEVGVDEESTPIPGDVRKTLEIMNLASPDQEIVKLLAEGYTEKEVAVHLKMSLDAVHSHVKNLYKRLGVSSRAQLIALYWRGNSE